METKNPLKRTENIVFSFHWVSFHITLADRGAFTLLRWSIEAIEYRIDMYVFVYACMHVSIYMCVYNRGASMATLYG